MKRFLVGLMLLLAMCLSSPSATIQWFHQQPPVTGLSNEMTLVFETGASNQYVAAPLSVLRNFTSGSTNGANANFTNTYIQNLTNNYLFSTNLFATNVYENFVTNNYLFATNLFATNVYENFVTNNYLFSTNLYATNEYVNFFTNNFAFVTNLYTTNEYVNFFTNNYAYITNLYVTNAYILYLTNDYAWSTNINVLNDITVQSNVYVTNIITAKTAYITNLTVISNLTANMDTLTNTAGYVGAAMADTNWVLSQIANLGSYVYFLGPTNSTAITNSGETVSRTNVWKGSLTPYTAAATQTVSGLTLNAYIRHVISTNSFSAIEAGPISITSYPFRTGGAGTVSGHWEIYWVDTVSNIMHEIAAAPTQIISATAPTFTQTSLTLTNGYTFTNKAYIACAFRLDSIGTGGPTLSWAYGGDYDAHLTFVRPLSSATINSSQVVGIKGYIVLASPFNCDGAGCILYTNDNTKTYFGQGQFNNAADQAANYCNYYITVPEDFDSTIDWKVERFKFQLGGADTGTHRYVISFDSVADSAAYAGSVGDAINLDFGGDASGASGDVETVSAVTLTGWRSAMTAGQLLVIRVARDGNDAADASTVDSYGGPIVLSYGIRQ